MRGGASGGAVKRQREQEVEEDAPASVQVTAHAEPLMLLALVKAYFDMLVWLQLCNPQGVALFSFVRLPPRMPRPFAGAPVYDMSLTHAERLCAMGVYCTTTSTATTTSPATTTSTTAITRTTITVSTVTTTAHHTSYFEPQRNSRACHQMMQSIARRVASKPMAEVRDEAAKEAEELCASGQCAAAVVALQRAIDWGDLASLALKAWLLIEGREGVAIDKERGFKLAEEGARLGFHHCQGVVAYCYFEGIGCEVDDTRSLQLARESSGRGSRYGQVTLGLFHQWGYGGLAKDYAQALALYRLAAAQGFDGAQFNLGSMYLLGIGVAEDDAEGLRWIQLAAAQGYPVALYWVATCYKLGCGVRKNKAAAIRWYRRAAAAGYTAAARELQWLGA
jgi:hypothetical protein